jgi:CRISPR/Cas system-associated exonuclease Cas4 (RecB family)
MSSELKFFEEQHVYTVDNVPIPSVTTIIDAILRTYSSVPAWVLKRAQAIGKAVHTATEYYDKGAEMEELHPEVNVRLEAWKRFLKDYNIDKFDYIEKMLYSKNMWYCGTLDRCIGDTLIDIKTGNHPNGTESLQLSAYAMMLEENLGIEINKIMIVRLNKNGDYVVERHKRIDSLFKSFNHVYSFINSRKEEKI